jgi:hypothetical protein
MWLPPRQLSLAEDGFNRLLPSHLSRKGGGEGGAPGDPTFAKRGRMWDERLKVLPVAVRDLRRDDLDTSKALAFQ